MNRRFAILLALISSLILAIAPATLKAKGHRLVASSSRRPPRSSARMDQALCAAVRSDDLASVRRLIRRGANINCREQGDQTPLIICMDTPAPRIARFLIDHGANVNAGDATSRLTALHFAAGFDETGMIGMLLKAGAHINTRDSNGETPLMCAATFTGSCGSSDSPEAVRVLLAAGALVNLRDSEGQTALMQNIAAFPFSAPSIVCPMLISHHADVNVRDQHGNTALSLAKKALRSDCNDSHDTHEMTVVIRMLRKAGARA